MSQVWLGGRIVDAAGNPMAAARISIDFLLGNNSAPVELRNSDGAVTGMILTLSESDGAFGLNFQFSSPFIGNATGAVLHVSVAGVRSRNNAGDVTGWNPPQRFPLRLAQVVSMREIANGAIPNPKKPGGLAGMALSLWRQIRKIKLPRTPTISASAEYYAFMGFYELRVR